MKQSPPIRERNETVGTVAFNMLLDVIDSQGQRARQQSTVTPHIWAVTEGRVGDDKQVLALAESIGGVVQRVHLRESLPEIFGGRLLNSFGLHAPWHTQLCGDSPLPDLMIAAGGRCAALARRIKHASGGRTKVVIIGRPWARLSDFDLVVTTPQYALPQRHNVQVNLLPLNCIDIDREDKIVSSWSARFAQLPGPWTGVLIGGNSGSFRFTAACARRLAQRLNAIVAKTGGSLLLTTSARTPMRAIECLQRDLSAPHHLHIWRSGQIDNPLTAILALADRLVVTGESASMIAEAVNTGKPVEPFQLRERRASRVLTTVPSALGLHWLVQLGPVLGYWTPPRDMRRLHQALQQRGLTGACDEAGRATGELRLVDRDLARTASRIRQLLVPARADQADLRLPAALQGQSA